MGSNGTSRHSIPQPWIETPLIESAALSRAAGCRIFLKLENLQPSGSFKTRGIGNLIVSAISRHPPGTKLHFYSSSGGNAGLATVVAATSLGYPSTVVVPNSTKPLMISKLRVNGANEVVQTGDSWADADRFLQETVTRRAEGRGETAVYVPPFDHEDIWAGNATLVDEVSEQLNGRPDAVICSVGGGGLFVGVKEGLDRVFGRDEIPVLAMETVGAESLHESLRGRKLVRLPGITSVATALGATQVASRAFELGQRKNVKSVVLEDAEACMGCWRLADDERILVEAACGVSVAVCYDGRLKRLLPRLAKDSKVVIVVCGGSNITLNQLAEYRVKYGIAEEQVIGNVEKVDEMQSRLIPP